MSVQRKQYSAELKVKVALEAIKCQKTTNEIASEYGVHPSQISRVARNKRLMDFHSFSQGKIKIERGQKLRMKRLLPIFTNK